MEEKLLVGGMEYQVKQKTRIADRQYILAESKKKKEMYIVFNLLKNSNCELYTDVYVSNDYLTAIEDWSNRIQSAVQSCKTMRDVNSDSNTVKPDEVVPLNSDTDINNKIIVLRENSLIPEYRYRKRQIYLCIGGFGADNSTFGHSVVGINLYTGEISRFTRTDIMGVLKSECAPDWVIKKIRSLQEQYSSSVKI